MDYPVSKFTGFESSSSGQQHYEKHGDEVGASSKSDYIRRAKEFGEARNPRFKEANIGNVLIKYDPVTGYVFIANKRKIRTFYKWDPSFSSDPFVYAIYYTITNNMNTPLADLGEMLIGLAGGGYDLPAMEREVIRNQLMGGATNLDIQGLTHAPIETIEEERDWLLTQLGSGPRPDPKQLMAPPELW